MKNYPFISISASSLASIWYIGKFVSVGAWYFTATLILCSLMSLFTIIVTLPSELPMHYAKFHWCIPRLVTL